jgi:hypothetical protein
VYVDIKICNEIKVVAKWCFKNSAAYENNGNTNTAICAAEKKNGHTLPNLYNLTTFQNKPD